MPSLGQPCGCLLYTSAIFAEKTRQDTVETLKETLDVLEETKEDVSDEEMIEIRCV